MAKCGFLCFLLIVSALGTLPAQDQPIPGKGKQVVLKYLGTAGWEITDGTTTILIDPYLSRINGPAPPGGGSGHPLAGDTRRGTLLRRTWRQLIRTFNEQISFSSLIPITTTSWMFLISPSKLAPQ
jgi:hypothetical protein